MVQYIGSYCNANHNFVVPDASALIVATGALRPPCSWLTHLSRTRRRSSPEDTHTCARARRAASCRSGLPPPSTCRCSDKAAYDTVPRWLQPTRHDVVTNTRSTVVTNTVTNILAVVIIARTRSTFVFRAQKTKKNTMLWNHWRLRWWLGQTVTNSTSCVFGISDPTQTTFVY